MRRKMREGNLTPEDQNHYNETLERLQNDFYEVATGVNDRIQQVIEEYGEIDSPEVSEDNQGGMSSQDLSVSCLMFNGWVRGYLPLFTLISIGQAEESSKDEEASPQ